MLLSRPISSNQDCTLSNNQGHGLNGIRISHITHIQSSVAVIPIQVCKYLPGIAAEVLLNLRQVIVDSIEFKVELILAEVDCILKHGISSARPEDDFPPHCLVNLYGINDNGVRQTDIRELVLNDSPIKINSQNRGKQLLLVIVALINITHFSVNPFPYDSIPKPASILDGQSQFGE